MKKFNCFTAAAIFLFAFILFTVSCDKDDEDNPVNVPPNCTIVNPTEGHTFNAGQEITISVNASDSDGSIDRVVLTLNNIELTTLNNAPYEYDWTIEVSEYGSHLIKATAYDNAGDQESDEVSINITSSSGCDGVSEISYDGQTYHTVEIGGQCWLKENLNYETGNSKCYEDNPANCQTYGRLYDWETALTACPEGWHLPSDQEWKTLLGFADSEYEIGDPVWDGTSWRGFDAGKNLKAASGWGENYNGTDKYGFSALPGGVYDDIDEFFYIEEHGIWWSSTEGTEGIWTYDLGWDEDRVYRGMGFPLQFISVSCIKD